MNSDMRKGIGALLIAFEIVFCFMFFAIGYHYGAKDQLEAIERLLVEKGHAEYNNKTGEWQWKE